ncbi:MAG: crossover junction endodeoxyribonuclease RuvC [Candidatus Omnitrophica bacterium]|nr:crossover junction endodeoxyribonuclease RuvC [Candidatus Omnitrophota bacterium]
MKILGIDPGLKATGFGVVDLDGRGRITPIDVGTIEPKAKDLLEIKLFKIHKILDGIIAKHVPDVVVLEKLFTHSAHPVTAAIMGHTRGVICLVCVQRNVKLVQYSVKRIRKAVVGNGNATKEQTRRVVANILKINAEQLTLDASDALALALGHASMDRIGQLRS